MWLYAIVSGASGPFGGEGMTGERLSRIRVAGLDLVVGSAPASTRPVPAVLRRYDATIRRLMETHAGVLPARFGTSAPTVEALSASVRDRRASLRRALRPVRHRVQMTVRVFAGRASRTHSRDQSRRATPTPSGAGDGPGRRFLLQRAAELQIPGTDSLRAAVRKWVRAERVERYERGRLAGTLYHLIPRGAAGPYQRALERSALEADVTIVISGPWPPYAFTGDAW